MSLRTTITALAVTLFTVGTLPAQIGPQDNIKKILETIDEELQEIDRLLMQSRNRQSGSSSADQMRKLIKETQGSQKRVVRGIDQLIEELNNMSQQQSQSGGQGEKKDRQQGQQDPLQDQEQSQRQRTQTGEQKAPEPQGQKPQDGQQPKDGQKNPKDAKNRTDGEQVPEGEERVVRPEDRARWGNLPTYDLTRHLRGGFPSVPEKYRRLLDAYHKGNQKTRKGQRK